MKELNLIGFYKVDMQVKHLEMIHESLDDKLKNYLDMMESDDWVADVQSARKIFASFAMEVRRNAHQIDRVVDELKKMADTKLNDENHAREKIKSVNNYELAKQYAGES